MYCRKVLDTVILSTQQNYIVQKQAMGGQSVWDRDIIHPITSHCYVKWFWSCYFQVK